MNRIYIIAAIIALIVSLLVVNLAAPKSGSTEIREPVQARILERGKIRCAYALRPPGLYKDMETNQLTGFGYEMMMEAAKRLSLEVEWAEEVGFGTIVDSVKTGRVDMGCGVYWPNAPRSRYIAFTDPMYYETIYIYARKDEPRKITSYEELNDPQYSFSTIDGGTPAILRKRYFPLAEEKALPELSHLGDMFEDVVAKKADFVINPEIMARDFEAMRPGTIKRLLDKPLTIYPVVMFLPAGETQLKAMMDATFREMEYDGTTLAIIRKYKVDDVLKFNSLPQYPPKE
ncbi:MAG: transporter substrate-binding domain-containing protein [Alphaproteobacteria bacterium]|nr:transporter substrate-binding domain-containing protein [Alphaproteobacteria bacterium]